MTLLIVGVMVSVHEKLLLLISLIAPHVLVYSQTRNTLVSWVGLCCHKMYALLCSDSKSMASLNQIPSIF